MNTTPRALLVAGALLLPALLAGCGTDPHSPTAAEEPEAAYDTAVRDATGDWLTGQLAEGVAHNREYAFDDLSLSADIALGLHLAGVEDQTVTTVADAVGSRVTEYVAPGFGTEVAAGSTAKALVLTEVAGQDPTAVGAEATDLVATLEETVVATGPSTGRIADRLDPANTEAVDYANVIGQSYAVWGLTAADSDRAEDATAYLLQQQCEEGWFRVTFTTDPTAPDQSCDADQGAVADPDATAFAVIALAGLESPSAEAVDSLERATAWLAEQQGEDGSFSSAQPAVANANTTGLAGWALARSGDTEAAERAAGWVARHVVTCNVPGAGEAAGAVAYDDAALSTAERTGITVKTEGQFRLATAQALPVLSYLPEDAVPGGFEDC